MSCRKGITSSDHFSLGRPSYFDLSVRYTTQSSFIFSAISQAGVAGGGEEAKDNHYLETVNNYGGDFILLVCKSFGVWSSFTLSSYFVYNC